MMTFAVHKLPVAVRKHDEFCIKNEKPCIKNEELCIKTEEHFIQNAESARFGGVLMNRCAVQDPLQREIDCPFCGVEPERW